MRARRESAGKPVGNKYGLMVDPDALISDITVGMQQRTRDFKDAIP